MMNRMNIVGDYPLGAKNDPSAPWNKRDNDEKEIDVTVSITLSKTMRVKVSDYKVVGTFKDEFGESYDDIDCSDCDLKGAVKSQVTLPNKAYERLAIPVYDSGNHMAIKAVEDLRDWCVDDFEVIPED